MKTQNEIKNDKKVITKKLSKKELRNQLITFINEYNEYKKIYQLEKDKKYDWGFYSKRDETKECIYTIKNVNFDNALNFFSTIKNMSKYEFLKLYKIIKLN